MKVEGLLKFIISYFQRFIIFPFTNMADTDLLFLFTSNKNDTDLIVKAADSIIATSIAAKVGANIYNRLYHEIEKWTFIDANNIPVEDETEMQAHQQELAKWSNLKIAASCFINELTVADVKDLDAQKSDIETYITSTIDTNISSANTSLGLVRDKFVVYNTENL